jgi:hypothetical protein
MATVCLLGPHAQQVQQYPCPGRATLRVGYVLPSGNLKLLDGVVFWPLSTDPLFRVVGVFPFPTSDHRLVWVDLRAHRHR